MTHHILMNMLEFAPDQGVEIKPLDDVPARRAEIPTRVYEEKHSAYREVHPHQAA